MSDMIRGGWLVLLVSAVLLAGLAAVDGLRHAVMVLAAVGILVSLLVIHVGMRAESEQDDA